MLVWPGRVPRELPTLLPLADRGGRGALSLFTIEPFFAACSLMGRDGEGTREQRDESQDGVLISDPEGL